MATEARDLQPKCEDYHSDDSEDDHVLQEAFRRSPGAAGGQANVAAKRSHPSDLGTDKPVTEKVVNVEVQSDSGYSSHTAATMSSADSAPSAKASQSPPAAQASAASLPPPSPATTKKRPALVTDDRKTTSQSSPRKPLQRTGSVSSKRPPGTRRPTLTDDVCKDPNCSKCGPNALPHRGRRSNAADSGLDVASYAPSQRSDPAPSTRYPPSPTYSRQPPPYAQGSTVVQPAQTRRRSSSNTRRPLSFQGDPGPNYWVPGMPGMPAPYPSPPQDHGPPPSMSAHYNMQHPQMSSFMLGATPPNYYGHAGSMGQMGPMSQMSPPYEHQRPPLSTRNSTSYQTRTRPASTLITYDRGDQPMPSARYPDAPQSAREPRAYASQFESSSDDYSSEEEEEELPVRSDRALMPPPKIKSSRERPALRHAHTTQVVNQRRESLSQSQMLPERTRERDPRASRISAAGPSRTPSVSRRPALIQHTQSAQETSRTGKAIVETSRGRRQSYQAYDREYDRGYDKEYLKEQKQRNRNSKMFYPSNREDAIVVPERSRRREDYPTKTKEKQKFMDAEAYQQLARGSMDPLTDQIHKAAKRASRIPSGASEGSSRSEDRKTRASQSNRTAITNSNANSEIRLRVDASAPLSLSFNGDMEGRTLQINPAEDGMADIVIGSSRGENTYRSEKGSVAGDRKSRLAGSARREAEEMSIRSSRSGQGRREPERDRKVLRRRRDTDYH